MTDFIASAWPVPLFMRSARNAAHASRSFSACSAEIKWSAIGYLSENAFDRFGKPIPEVPGNRSGTGGAQCVCTDGVRDSQSRQIGPDGSLHSGRRIFDHEALGVRHRQMTEQCAGSVEPFETQPE